MAVLPSDIPKDKVHRDLLYIRSPHIYIIARQIQTQDRACLMDTQFNVAAMLEVANTNMLVLQ